MSELVLFNFAETYFVGVIVFQGLGRALMFVAKVYSADWLRIFLLERSSTRPPSYSFRAFSSFSSYLLPLQRMRSCQEHSDREGLKQQSLAKTMHANHKHYVLPGTYPGCYLLC